MMIVHFFSLDFMSFKFHYPANAKTHNKEEMRGIRESSYPLWVVLQLVHADVVHCIPERRKLCKD